MRTPRRALTLLEVTFSIALTLLIVIPLVAGLIGSNRTVAGSREQKIAMAALHAKVERLRAEASTSFNTLPTLYATTAQREFFVQGLPSRPGNAAHGLVTLLLDETDPNNPARTTTGVIDLDNSGSLTSLSGTDRFRVVPARIEIRWGPANGGGSLVLETIITQNNNFNRQTS